MNDIIDVLAIQQNNQAMKMIKTRPTDYRKKEMKGMPAKFLFECSIKLNMKPLTSAMAAILFHRFYKEVDVSEYEPYMIAASCLYLSAKIKDDPVKIRDVINVTHNTMNRGAQPLELNDEYWSMRDTIVQAELFITRVLKFDLTTVHPHKYMLHYMKTLQDWFGHKEWSMFPIAKTAAAFLQDFHHSPAILNYKPSHVALCCLSFAFQTYGVSIPMFEELDENSNVWYHAFAKDLTKELHWEIMDQMMDVYNHEIAIDESVNMI